MHPPEFENTEGDGRSATSTDPARFQQVHVGELFPVLPESQRWIAAFSYRPDRSLTRTVVRLCPQYEVRLSTTHKTPEGLSSTFAENIGSDEQLVHDGPITFSTNNTGPADGPKEFDLTVKFDTPFYYDPALGNLLLELVVPEGLRTPITDQCCENEVPPPIGWVARTGDFDLPTANLRGLGGGLQFTFVPEPSTEALLFMACWGSFACGVAEAQNHACKYR